MARSFPRVAGWRNPSPQRAITPTPSCARRVGSGIRSMRVVVRPPGGRGSITDSPISFSVSSSNASLRSGAAPRMIAQAAATCGAANDVPPSAERPGVAISQPGASSERWGEVCEAQATWSSSVVSSVQLSPTNSPMSSSYTPPTLMTDGTQAGAAMPSLNTPPTYARFPDAAIGWMPAASASANGVARASEVQGAV